MSQIKLKIISGTTFYFNGSISLVRNQEAAYQLDTLNTSEILGIVGGINTKVIECTEGFQDLKAKYDALRVGKSNKLSNQLPATPDVTPVVAPEVKEEVVVEPTPAKAPAKTATKTITK